MDWYNNGEPSKTVVIAGGAILHLDIRILIPQLSQSNSTVTIHDKQK